MMLHHSSAVRDVIPVYLKVVDFGHGDGDSDGDYDGDSDVGDCGHNNGEDTAVQVALLNHLQAINAGRLVLHLLSHVVRSKVCPQDSCQLLQPFWGDALSFPVCLESSSCTSHPLHV